MLQHNSECVTLRQLMVGKTTTLVLSTVRSETSMNTDNSSTAQLKGQRNGHWVFFSHIYSFLMAVSKAN
jgi:hypothetical protein